MSLVKKYNIALLGKTGVGKSTLVNSFANYMKYDSFTEAFRNEPTCVIPTQYYMESQSGKGYDISLGKSDKNESHVDGHSCTQKPRVYEFNLEDDQFNFIDVPGIGDTRGTEIDQENRKEILNVLSTFKELHGILILLTTQDCKLTAEYKYCLTEILTMIHVDALQNIFFVFTNSSGQDYRGGQSMPLLRAYLQELRSKNGILINISKDNTFFIDNEGFRLHGFYNQHPSVVEKRDLKKAKRSWEHTKKQMNHLLDGIRETRPTEVQSSISVNEARTIGFLLLEPLATVTTLITQNTLEHDPNADNMAKKVKDALKVVEYGIEIIKLEQPRTVCTSASCIVAAPMIGTDRFTTHYKQVCHDPCYLRGVQLKAIPEPRLLDCAAMGGNRMCNKCAENGHDCSYEYHMHIDYEQRTVARETVLTRVLNAAYASADPKAAMNKIMAELEEEQTVILKTVQRFMAFLKANAIYEHNEYFENRLDVEIRNQQAIADKTGDTAVLNKLKGVKQKYKQNMDALNVMGEMPNHGRKTEANDILEMRDRMFNLKYNGPKIREIYYTTSDTVLSNTRTLATREVPTDN